MSDGKWGDLGPRAGSAVVMIAVGAVALWLGGIAFALLATLIVVLMIWELVRMVRPRHEVAARQEAGIVAVLFPLAILYPSFAVFLLLIAAGVLAGRTGTHMGLVALYTGGIFLAGLGLVQIRLDHGMGMALWLVGLVVITDVAGYFAGRILGGPKFWPKVSPKKTWSGTVAGWIGAVILSLIVAIWVYDWPMAWVIWTVPGAVALSLASQMGDIAESAIKRKMKVKDSSNLIPGHGGVMDRFDGMMGAGLALMLGLLVVHMAA
ncbi:phosphatidate cytidylyltransferase [Rhodalgimonas zhirmunskyi]|uniref:Phosphatidate cytidylyltransferase n=1 Tax=Rhodalgimonas zhirmunskyi TaxID=2964767 RepID=A0AAJ1X4J9_9RHOB|nr:phosphatidate cytidylyltransferase [Rhodoalgimonas zhirmunskyi]MDQ2092589.1 phosphatidate cytidylyltransferase [Rhodoalgimonas zhirmunskyi]